MLELTACRVDLTRGTLHPRSADAPTPTTSLTTREADLLRYFAEHPHRVISRDELLAVVWGYTDAVVSRACDNTVRRLREKVELDPSRPDHVLTVHGSGYRFEPPGSAEPEPQPAPGPAEPPVLLGEIRIDLHRLRILKPDGEIVALTPTEAALLGALLHAGGALVERETLARAGWGRVAAGSRVVDGTIRRLRSKLEPDPSDPKLLVTMRGGGYQLVIPPPPVPRAEILGRDGLLDQILGATASSRWVLLLGPAGVGKSTLARRVADEHTGEVVWLDLATALAPDEAAAIAARGLGVHLGSRDPVDRVAEALALRPGALVVLDNLEGVARSTAVVERWVSLAPRTRFLGTSRTRIGAPGEQVIEVGPLDRASAVALFVRRARAASSVNREIDQHQALIETLVERLERMPLAIELAAARTAALGVADLLAHLRLDLLAQPGPSQDQGGRHHTLRGVIEATLDALPRPLLEALHDLVLFRSGLSIDDARGVLGEDAIDLIQGLRDHSLLSAIPRGPTLWFDVWQAVRERIDEAGPAEPARIRRHAAHLARWGEEAAFERIGWQGTEAVVERMRQQVDDLARAARAALEIDESGLAAACASAAAWVYEQSGPYAVGLDLIEEVLQRPVEGRMRARLLLQLGNLQRYAGLDPEAAWMEAASVAAEHDAPWVEHQALGSAARQCRRQGRTTEVRALAQRAVDAAQRWDPRSGVVEWMQFLIAERDGDQRAQGELLSRGLARAERASNLLLAAQIGLQLNEYELNGFRRGRARARAERAYEQFSAFGLRSGMVVAAIGAGDASLQLRDPEGARRWTAALREGAARLDSPLFQALALQLTARALLLDGALDEAEAALREVQLVYDPPPPLLDAQTEEIWVDLGCRRRDAPLATAHAIRSASLYRSLKGFSHAAAVRARAAAAWIAAGDIARARSELEASFEPDVPVMPVRLAAEARLARAEGRFEEAARLLAELRAHPTCTEESFDSDDAALDALLGPLSPG